MSNWDNDRRRHGGNDRRREPRRPPPETEEQKLRNLILRIGDNPDFQPETALPSIAKTLSNALPAHLPTISDAFRYSILEQPYKTPYTAALFVLLSSPAESEEEKTDGDSVPLLKSIFEELCKAFQWSLDHLAWRDLRLTIHFFSYLVLFKAVSVSSYVELLQSFLVVLDEPGVSHERLEAAALCVGEGLLRAGEMVHDYDAGAVETIVSTIKCALPSTLPQRALTRPVFHLYSEEVIGANELLDSLVEVLSVLSDASFHIYPTSLPQPHLIFPPSTSSFDIPSSIVPPEDLEFEENPSRRIVMPGVRLRFYDDEITPSPLSPAGYIVRSCIIDTLNIFEVNRRECGRVLLELPRWFPWGTFKNKPSFGSAPEDEDFDAPRWILEMTILEVALAELSLLPFSPQVSIYYAALISDLCKLSPETVGPAVGKSIRKFYSLLGEGLDVEAARRLTDWFAVHMSNFTFNWVWKEWIPDLELPLHHPRRQFIRRAIELETRLAYHDRIMKTLPDPFLDPDTECVPSSPPGPEFDYESPQHPYYEPAQSLLNLVRGRTPVDEVIKLSDTLRGNISETVTLPPETSPDSAVRHITMQILLHVGSRSISHFLNAIERYLPLLRSLGSQPEHKVDFLNAAARFWMRHGQMISIVFDKLMQYQIVDPSDIIAWSFRRSVGDSEKALPISINVQTWDLLKAALDKAIGRLTIAQLRVQGLRKDEEDAQAKATAAKGGVDAMEIDSEAAIQATKLGEAHKEIAEQLAAAEKAQTVLAREQKMALARVLEGFVAALVTEPSHEASSVVTEAGWDARAEWTSEQSEHWETWGWYRNFSRFYAAQLKANQVTFEAGPLADVSANADIASTKLARNIWDVAIGRSS